MARRPRRRKRNIHGSRRSNMNPRGAAAYQRGRHVRRGGGRGSCPPGTVLQGGSCVPRPSTGPYQPYQRGGSVDGGSVDAFGNQRGGVGSTGNQAGGRFKNGGGNIRVPLDVEKKCMEWVEYLWGGGGYWKWNGTSNQSCSGGICPSKGPAPRPGAD